MIRAERVRHFFPLVLLLAAWTNAVPQRAAAVAGTLVPIRLVNNHVHLEMTSGGRELSMLLDTGAGITLIDIPVAEMLGFRFGRPANIGGVGAGTTRAFLLEDGTLTLPQDSGIRVKPRVALAMSLGPFEGVPVHGILGADFIRQSVVQLDYAAQRMILHPRPFRYAGTGIRVPLTFRDGQPHAVGHIILPDSTRLEADCHIDVGASGGLMLTKPFVDKHHLRDRVGPTIRRRSGRGVGGSPWATLGRVARVQLGAAELQQPVVAMFGDSAGVMSTDRSFECNIGGEILRRFVVYLDYERSEMILEPTAAVNEPFDADMGGLAARVDSAGGIRVTDVMPGGPAETADIREGDLIVRIDGRPALEYGLEALRRRLRQDGSEVELNIRRGAEERTIRLTVRRLI